jgi:hypothetical protein
METTGGEKIGGGTPSDTAADDDYIVEFSQIATSRRTRYERLETTARFLPWMARPPT